MSRITFIFLFVLIMSVGLASCDTTRRASRRIQNIVNEHPELLSQDTVQCDVTVTVTPPADSTTFSLDDFNEAVTPAENDTCNSATPNTTNPTVIHKTESGTFTIEKTGDEEYKVTYTPDTLQVEAKADVVVPKLTIQEEHKTSFAEILQWLAIGIIAILFARLLLMKIK